MNKEKLQEVLAKCYNTKILFEEFNRQMVGVSNPTNMTEFAFRMGEWKTTLERAIKELTDELEDMKDD